MWQGKKRHCYWECRLHSSSFHEINTIFLDHGRIQTCIDEIPKKYSQIIDTILFYIKKISKLFIITHFLKKYFCHFIVCFTAIVFRIVKNPYGVTYKVSDCLTVAKHSHSKRSNKHIVHFSVIRNAVLLNFMEQRRFNDLQYTVTGDAHILI